jgi:DUF4097 and DUF4098 domain-containing protein YvlB
MTMNTRQIMLAGTLLLAIPAAHAVQNIDRTLPTGTTPVVDVSNVQGRVTVVAWDRQEVKVTGTIENDSHELEFSGGTDRVTVKVRIPSKSHSYGRKDDAILDIRVPEGSKLNVQTVSADISVEGVKGAQRLEAVSGDIVTTVYDETLDVRTVSGDADVRGNGGKGRVYAESTSGEVKARGLGSEVEAHSVSGSVDLEVGTTSRVRMETVSGNLEALMTLADNGRVDGQSVSGDINITFRKPVNAEFDVESFSGDIDNCFGPKASRESRYTPGKELNFTEGQGGGAVSLETLSGDITFCQQ